MDKQVKDYLPGRIKELANRAYVNNFVTHTDFLSAPELSVFYNILASEGVPSNVNVYNGAKYLVYGGNKDSERAVVCFLPEYLDEETFLLGEENEPSIINCVRLTPLNSKFSDALTHRDYLGAVMNLGIERDQIGDIYTGENEAYIFALPEVASIMVKELTRIRHTSVSATLVKPSECNIEFKFETLTGSVASERLDAIVAFVFHLSRSAAADLIENANVMVNGRCIQNAGRELKPFQRVSVRGHGKFIYEGMTNTTRKGRLFVSVKKFV